MGNCLVDCYERYGEDVVVVLLGFGGIIGVFICGFGRRSFRNSWLRFGVLWYYGFCGISSVVWGLDKDWGGVLFWIDKFDGCRFLGGLFSRTLINRGSMVRTVLEDHHGS